MDRRTFIKRIFQVAGFAGLVRMGLLEEANARGIFPAALNDGAASISTGSTWAAWSEATEIGLSSTQEATNDTFCIFGENTTASGNETGVGISTGADLVFTQGGSIPGATGTPPRRALGVNDYFDFTNGLASFIKEADKKWFACVKYGDVTTRGMYLDIFSAGAYIRVFNSGNKLYLQDASGNATSTDDTPTSGALYVSAWCDGATTKAGFTTAKPTKLSNFDAGKVVSFATAQNYSAVTFTSCCIGIASNDHVSNPVTGDWYYAVFSKACLIDNAS